jgi:hypothetical protein
MSGHVDCSCLVPSGFGCGKASPAATAGNLHDTALVTAVTALTGLAGNWDLLPGQRRELGVQARLVALDGEQVVRPADRTAGRRADRQADSISGIQSAGRPTNG